MIRRDFIHKVVAGVMTVAVLPTAFAAERAAKKDKSRDATPSPSPSSTAEDAPTEPAEPTPTERPTEKRDNAHLRLWKAADAPDLPLQLQLFATGASDAKGLSPIQITGLAYEFTNYVEVPTGLYVAEFSLRDHPIVRLPLYLVAGGQSTLLVRMTGTTMTAEWIDDTVSASDTECEFCVFNLLPVCGDVQVDLGTLMSVHLPYVQSNLRLIGIKQASYPVTINGTDGSGRNFRWNVDADFRLYRKATLLIYPDNYGRIRPRIRAN